MTLNLFHLESFERRDSSVEISMQSYHNSLFYDFGRKDGKKDGYLSCRKRQSVEVEDDKLQLHLELRNTLTNISLKKATSSERMKTLQKKLGLAVAGGIRSPREHVNLNFSLAKIQEKLALYIFTLPKGHFE